MPDGDQQPAYQKWEYRFFVKQTESYILTDLIEAGREGWELVSAVYRQDLKGIWCWTAFLKRPLLDGATSALRPAAAMAAGQASEQAPAEPKAWKGFDLSDGDFGFLEERPAEQQPQPTEQPEQKEEAPG
jgi:hypothetical protein